MKVVRTVPRGGKLVRAYLSQFRIGEPVLGKFNIVYITISISSFSLYYTYPGGVHIYAYIP